MSLASLFAPALSAQAPDAGAPSNEQSLEEQIERPLRSQVSREARSKKLGRVLVIGAAPKPRFNGEPISLSLKNADLQEVLRSFARIADVNLVLDPKVRGTVTVELHDVPWDHALWVILKSHGLAAELDGRLWRVQ